MNDVRVSISSLQGEIGDLAPKVGKNELRSTFAPIVRLVTSFALAHQLFHLKHDPTPVACGLQQRMPSIYSSLLFRKRL